MEDKQEFKQIGNFCYDLNSKPLGIGEFAKVYKGCEKGNTNEPVAIKVITHETLRENREFLDIFDREMQILRMIKGDHILNLKQILKSSSGNLYIITSFCNGGSLEQLLTKAKRLSESQALKIVKEVSKGFVEIENLDLKNSKGEKMTMMHRDIKPANILFHDGVTKIADFGFAKLIGSEAKTTKQLHTNLGTPLYMAPEILINKEYSFKCDIWSMGMVLYEMLTGELPWTAYSTFELVKKITKQPIQFPEYISKECQNLIMSMLKLDEAERIDWKEILKHPAIAGRSSSDSVEEKSEETKPKKKSTVRIIEDVQKPSSEQVSMTNKNNEEVKADVGRPEQKNTHRIQIISQSKPIEEPQQVAKKTKIQILEAEYF